MALDGCGIQFFFGSTKPALKHPEAVKLYGLRPVDLLQLPGSQQVFQAAMGWFLADGSWGPQLELTKAPSCRTSNLFGGGIWDTKDLDAEKTFSQLDMQSQELGSGASRCPCSCCWVLGANQSIDSSAGSTTRGFKSELHQESLDTTWPKPLWKAIFPSISIYI